MELSEKKLRLTNNQWIHTSQMMGKYCVPHEHLDELDIRVLYRRMKKLQFDKNVDDIFRCRAARAIYRKLCSAVGIDVEKYKLECDGKSDGDAE